MRQTLIDEYGFAYTVETGGENRRDLHGHRLGPKPIALQQMPYDLKQIESPVEPRLTAPPEVDISGRTCGS
jgi:hypothetical protein